MHYYELYTSMVYMASVETEDPEAYLETLQQQFSSSLKPYTIKEIKDEEVI